MHGNYLVATIAIIGFTCLLIGYSLGWLQRDEQTPTREIGAAPALPDLACERYRRELGFRTHAECDVCTKPRHCEFSADDIESRARQFQ